jgi:prolyl oligopeptidase
MKKYILLLTIIMVANQHSEAQFKYPKTRQDNTSDVYFSTKIADPYRWLENDTAVETKAWVHQQNEVTFNYLKKIPFRDQLRDRIKALNNFPKYSSPFRAGKYYFFYKNSGLQNQSVLYIQEGLEGEPKVFLDPNTYSTEGTVSIGIAGVSKNDQYIVFTLGKAGSDWQEMFVMEVGTGKKLSDKLEWVKFSGASWLGNGFYYSRYDKPSAGLEFSSQNKYHKIYYHRLGTKQSEDELIYSDAAHPLRYFGATVTENEKYLIVSVSEGTSGTEMWYKDLKNAAQKEFKLLFKGFDHEYGVVDCIGNDLIVETNHGAALRKIISVNPAKPETEYWKVLIPEQGEMIDASSTGGGKLFVSYLKDCSTRINQYQLNGTLEHSIELPGIGSAGGIGGKMEDKLLFYTYTSFTSPPTIYKYDVATGESSIFRKPELKFNPEEFVVKQEFVKTNDGALVPMFIVHRRGLEKTGKNPTLLYSYGGFNISLTPSFSASRIAFLEQGGIYVMANIRGGGEYGEDWHKGGMLLNKQTVFNDFIKAAEYLIQEGYTSSEYLAIQGGSNGGLLVGACMTQRPDLYKVAFPAVGVLDMLRYHKFTVGWGWAVEYGTSEKEADFKNLLSYSPLHNIKNGQNYPATLVTTADHDDRVVPAHSFKFISALQEHYQGPNPVMIRIETNAGHGAGKPIGKQIEEVADIFSFLFWNMNIAKLEKY